jgi:hypothetical protein
LSAVIFHDQNRASSSHRADSIDARRFTATL